MLTSGYIKVTSQRKILIVAEEGWFGQPKYSTYIKTILRRAGFYLYFLLFRCSSMAQKRRLPELSNKSESGDGSYLRQSKKI